MTDSGKESIPELARAWLGRLADMGLHTTVQLYERYEVKLKSGQRFWIEFPPGRERSGLRKVEIGSNTRRDDKAILAALTVLQSNPTDIERFNVELSPKIGNLVREGTCENIRGALQQILPEGAETQPIAERDEQWTGLHHLREGYEVDLLEYFRPDFSSQPLGDQLALLGALCERINIFVTSVDSLTNFLEYGSPGSDLRPEVENAFRDVRAAVLKDAAGLLHRVIGEKLGIDPPKSERDREKNDYPTVRQIVKRGRSILERAMGQNEWKQKAQSMQSDARLARDFRRETEASIIADHFGIAGEEVITHLRDSDDLERIEYDEQLKQRIGINDPRELLQIVFENSASDQ